MYENALKEIEDWKAQRDRYKEEYLRQKDINNRIEEHFKLLLDDKKNQIKDLKSNKNGCLQTLEHLEVEIKKELFIDAKINLLIQYNELLKTYNKIDEKEREEDFRGPRRSW